MYCVSNSGLKPAPLYTALKDEIFHHRKQDVASNVSGTTQHWTLEQIWCLPPLHTCSRIWLVWVFFSIEITDNNWVLLVLCDSLNPCSHFHSHANKESWSGHVRPSCNRAAGHSVFLVEFLAAPHCCPSLLWWATLVSPTPARLASCPQINLQSWCATAQCRLSLAPCSSAFVLQLTWQLFPQGAGSILVLCSSSMSLWRASLQSRARRQEPRSRSQGQEEQVSCFHFYLPHHPQNQSS